MIQINLLPVRAQRRKEFIRKQLSIAGLSIVLAVVVMGVLYYRLQTQCTAAKKHLQQTNKKIKQLEPVIKKIDVYKKQKDEISKKIAVIIDLDRLRPVPVLILSDLNRLRPQKLWFSSLKSSGQQLTITGVAIDNETIVEFLNNLKQSAILKNADLTLLRSQEIEKVPLKGFTISCRLALDSLDSILNSSAPKEQSPGEEKNG